MRLTISGEEFSTQLYHLYLDGKSDEDVRKWWASIQPQDLNEGERFEPDDGHLANLREDFMEAVKNKREEVSLKIKEWFRLNPHLPQPSIGMIFKFLWAAKDNEEQCKKSLTRYYALRGNDDDIFGNRDPVSDAARKLHAVSNFTCLSTFTPELYRINISVLREFDPDKFSAQEWVRRIFYLSDLRVRDDFCLGDVMIYDLKGFSLQHLMKFDLALVRKMVIAAEGALPTRIKQIHMVNCPGFVDKITSLYKPLLKEKIRQRVFVHMDGYEGLLKHLPKHILPKEYGGTSGTIDESSDSWVKIFEENRDWFIREEKTVKRIYMEGKKSGKLFVDCGELFGMEGSFKKLALD